MPPWIGVLRIFPEPAAHGALARIDAGGECEQESISELRRVLAVALHVLGLDCVPAVLAEVVGDRGELPDQLIDQLGALGAGAADIKRADRASHFMITRLSHFRSPKHRGAWSQLQIVECADGDSSSD